MGNNCLIALGVWNFLVFLLYGIDKWQAVNRKWRIREKALISVAFLMGAAGAVIGMQVFRHKTRKPIFCIFIGIAFLVNLVVIYLFERI